MAYQYLFLVNDFVIEAEEYSALLLSFRNDQRLRSGFFGLGNLRNFVGAYNADLICPNTTFAISVISDEHSKELTMQEFSQDLSTILKSLINELWLIKDCSCSFYLIAGRDDRGNNAEMMKKSQYLITNSSCTTSIQSFTVDEMNEAVEFYSIKRSLGKLKTIKNDIVDNQLQKMSQASVTLVYPDVYKYEYNDHNRIERAFILLSFVRTASYLPIKISLYVPILEALFSTGSATELTYRVSERIAFYLGETSKEKQEIFSLVKNCYDFRSKFLHGLPVPKSFKTMDAQKELSRQIDSLLRVSLRKILKKDLAIFQGSDDDINDYFKSLIF